MPHEYVPWSEGRNFASPRRRTVVTGAVEPLPHRSDRARGKLLTEDNLPSYHREVERVFGRDSEWGVWVNRWTAEEGRHAF